MRIFRAVPRLPNADSSANRIPGPGAYDSRPADKVVRRSASAFTMAPRTEPDKEAERKPAPGAYDPDYRCGGGGGG